MTPSLEEALKQAMVKSRTGWVEPITLDEADFKNPPEPEPPGDIIFQAASGETILVIHPDGTLERGSHFATDDEASMAMFDCMSRGLPCFLADLQERAMKAELMAEILRNQIQTRAADH